MYKLYTYVPEAHLESIKVAMFKAGAGKLGSYQDCSWQVLGTGQFTPLEGSTPYQGSIDKTETVREYFLTMECEEHFITDVLKALIKAHPYEVPVYGVWKVHILEDFQ